MQKLQSNKNQDEAMSDSINRLFHRGVVSPVMLYV